MTCVHEQLVISELLLWLRLFPVLMKLNCVCHVQGNIVEAPFGIVLAGLKGVHARHRYSVPYTTIPVRPLNKQPNDNCTTNSKAVRNQTQPGRLTLSDSRQVLSESVRNVTCASMPVLLDPEASASCIGYYVLTQGDVDEGIVTNEVGIFHV